MKTKIIKNKYEQIIKIIIIIDIDDKSELFILTIHRTEVNYESYIVIIFEAIGCHCSIMDHGVTIIS